MEDQVVELLSSLEQAVTTLAPEAWTALVAGAFIDGIRGAAFGALGSSWLIIYGLGLRRCIQRLTAAETDTEIAPPMVFLIAGGVAAIFSLVAFFEVGMDSRTWLGLLSPETQVVRDLLNKVS